MEVGEHYRPIGETLDPGIYRVVGTTDDVALLQVGDAAGRRVYTGEVTIVAREVVEDTFERAPNPDDGIHARRWVRNVGSGLYWEVRSTLSPGLG